MRFRLRQHGTYRSFCVQFSARSGENCTQLKCVVRCWFSGSATSASTIYVAHPPRIEAFVGLRLGEKNEV
jgi:hypothetical protein